MADQAQIDALRSAPVPPQELLVEGAWQAGEETPLAVISPIDGRQLTTIADATPAEVERAVASARAAFEDRRWAGQPPAAGMT